MRAADIPREADKPTAGYYLVRLVRGGPFVPAQIKFEDGLWSAIVDGRQMNPHIDPIIADHVHRTWMFGQACTKDEYEHRLKVSEWAKKHAPDRPEADPGKPIDLTKMPPIF